MGMKSLPPTNAQLRVDLAPLRTWVALSTVGLAITLARNELYGVPLVPVRTGATPFLAMTALGALYAASVSAWLAVRRLYVR